MEVNNGTNKGLRLTGHWLYKEQAKTLELWLEEDGFFRLIYEEKEENGFATNEEKGTYYSDSSPSSLVLAAVERSWKWKDSHDGDSGVDATDLKYPCIIKNDEIVVKYLEVDYVTKRTQ